MTLLLLICECNVGVYRANHLSRIPQTYITTPTSQLSPLRLALRKVSDFWRTSSRDCPIGLFTFCFGNLALHIEKPNFRVNCLIRSWTLKFLLLFLASQGSLSG